MTKQRNRLGALLLFAALNASLAWAAPAAGAPTTHAYAARGVVERIAPEQRQITIHHQAIPGYMMEMTMDFPVRNTNEFTGLSAGDQITFTLVVNSTNDWVENLHRIGQAAPVKAADTNQNDEVWSLLKPGDLLPDGALVTEDGRQIHLADFRGKAVAFTFFFTRCPLPDYCPRMNRNFAATRDLLLAMTNAPANWELLSVSFDGGFDQPEVLASYARLYRGASASHWLFAAATTKALAAWAPRIGFMVMRQGSNLSHNLRTIVLDPQGRLYRQFDGNTWTPRQLADAMINAAQAKTPAPAAD